MKNGNLNNQLFFSTLNHVVGEKKMRNKSQLNKQRNYKTVKLHYTNTNLFLESPKVPT